MLYKNFFRVRQFKIDAKGAVVSRGDSFRRKRNTAGIIKTISYKSSIFYYFSINSLSFLFYMVCIFCSNTFEVLMKHKH